MLRGLKSLVPRVYPMNKTLLIGDSQEQSGKLIALLVIES